MQFSLYHVSLTLTLYFSDNFFIITVVIEFRGQVQQHNNIIDLTFVANMRAVIVIHFPLNRKNVIFNSKV